MTEETEIEKNQRLLKAYAQKKREEEARRIFQLLPQGPGSGLDADMLDGKHFADVRKVAREEANKAVKKVPVIRVGGGGGSSGGGGILSNPPPGKKKIVNMYWDQDTQEIVVVTEP